MNLTPFLEAVSERHRRKNLKEAEKRISLIEADAATQVTYMFREQRRIIVNILQETFTKTYLKQTADRAELETYPAFKDVIVGGRVSRD